MAMHRTFRFAVTLMVALSILLAVPISAGTRGPEAPQPTLRAAGNWLNAALGWLQDALVVRHPGVRGHRPPAGWQKVDDNGIGGSCIDPQGDRYPPPCIRG